MKLLSSQPPLAGSQAAWLRLLPPRTPPACRHSTSHPQLRFCTALLFPSLPKVHFDNRPLESLVIILNMLNFLILFAQQYTITRPLQPTSPIQRSHQHTPASDMLAWQRSCAAALCALCVFSPRSSPYIDNHVYIYICSTTAIACPLDAQDSCTPYW